MKTVRMRGVGLDNGGYRKVIIKGQYYGHFGSLEEANARARDVWHLLKTTGFLPEIEQDGDKPVGECRLIPVGGQPDAGRPTRG